MFARRQTTSTKGERNKKVAKNRLVIKEDEQLDLKNRRVKDPDTPCKRFSISDRISLMKVKINQWSLPSNSKNVVMSKRLELSKKEHARFAPYGTDVTTVQTLHGIKKVRQEIYFVLHDENHSKLAFFVLTTILAVIIISTLFYILETEPALSKTKNQKYFWEVSEMVVTVIFTIEYVMRLLVVRNLCIYMVKPMNVVDLMAVLPYYVEKVIPQLPSTSLRVLRIIRLARLGRLRFLFSEYIEVMSTAVKSAADEAGPMLTLMILVQVVLFGSIVWAFENGHHKDGDFISIPDTMWWAFVTITTVGYGDLTPVTPIGRGLGVICMFSGIILMSIFVIIVGGNFEQAHQSMLQEKAQWEKPKNSIRDELLPEKSVMETPMESPILRSSYRSPKHKLKTEAKTVVTENRINSTKSTKLHTKYTTLKTSYDSLTSRVCYLEEQAKNDRFARKKASGFYSGRAGNLFPWLRRSSLLDRVTDEFKTKLIMYLNDNDIFLARSLSTSFYKAYYDQKISDHKADFNFKRAICLARKRRVFPNIEVLCIQPGEVSQLSLTSINVHSFPNLRRFFAYCEILNDGAKTWHIPCAFVNLKHELLEELILHLVKAPSTGNTPLIELSNFPSLKKLDVTFKEPSIFPLCNSHRSLQTIRLTNGSLKDAVDKQRFPVLVDVTSNILESSDRKSPLQLPMTPDKI